MSAAVRGTGGVVCGAGVVCARADGVLTVGARLRRTLHSTRGDGVMRDRGAGEVVLDNDDRGAQRAGGGRDCGSLP
jgi:hypothetical protein